MVPPQRGPWMGEPEGGRMNQRSQRRVQRASEGASSLALPPPSRRRRRNRPGGAEGVDPMFRTACGS